MKLKSLVHLLGVRPKPRTYGFEVRVFNLPEDGPVEYARWLHPNESTKEITQEAVDELRRFLRPGDVAIDIGAHTGDSTIPIALAVGPTGCVLALEPNKYVFPILAKNSQLNSDKTSIVPLMFAATPEDCVCEFEYSDSGFCNGGRHEGISKWRHAHAFRLPVQGRNLESFLSNEYPDLLPKISYVKVDAEGFDFTILKALTKLIARCKPYIKAEVYKHTTPSQREQFFDFLTGHDYAVYRIENESRYQAERLERAALTQWRHFDVFCVPQEKSH